MQKLIFSGFSLSLQSFCFSLPSPNPPACILTGTEHPPRVSQNRFQKWLLTGYREREKETETQSDIETETDRQREGERERGALVLLERHWAHEACEPHALGTGSSPPRLWSKSQLCNSLIMSYGTSRKHSHASSSTVRWGQWQVFQEIVVRTKWSKMHKPL